MAPTLDYDELGTLATGPYSATFGSIKTVFMSMATWSLLTWKMTHMICRFCHPFRR